MPCLYARPRLQGEQPWQASCIRPSHSPRNRADRWAPPVACAVEARL